MKVAFVYLNRDQCVGRGPGYVASSLMDAGHAVDFLDTVVLTLDEVIDRVTAGGYDVLMISASTLFYRQAMRLSESVKRVSSMPVVMGGVHAIVAKGDVLQECPSIDYLCVGEGESFAPEFLRALESGNVRDVANLGYRDEAGEVHLNPVRPAEDLDKLGRFRYELFSPGSVVQQYPLPGFCYVYATRGCPFRCSYCCNSCYFDLYKGSYLRTRCVDGVIAELKELKAHYPVQFFYFGDEMILFNTEYVTELFHRVRNELGLPYGCMARVEKITPAIVELFKETGCQYVGMGIECGDEEFRKKFLNRHMTNAQIVQAFALLRGVPGLRITSFNMTGYPVPYDARLTAKTHALNAKVKPDTIQISNFFPFQGTKLYDYCVEHNLIDFEKMFCVENVFSGSVLKPARKP